jgi:intracellular septation protein A
MPLRLSRYAKTFTVESHKVAIEHEAFVESSRSSLSLDGTEVAADGVEKGQPDPLRNHHLATTLPDGRVLEVEIGPANTWSYGHRATLDGAIVAESHRGKTLGYGPRMQAYLKWAEAQNTPDMKARNEAAWKRNWPSLAVDVSLGLIFFFVAREYGLVTAAVGGAAAGLVLWVAQKVTRIDLLGGLALFGIGMSLISAAFAVVFRDDSIVQHRSTIMGLIGASLFLSDGLFARGQKLAARLARYFAFDVDARRLALGMGGIGVVMALVNVLAVWLLTTDQWLVFTTFLDTPIVIALFLAMLFWVREGPEARAY